MGILVSIAVFLTCVVVFEIIGNPSISQSGLAVSAKQQQWRWLLFVIEIAAVVALVWQAGGE